jgi:putative proteasome-type protease
MTYCLGIITKSGLVMAADSRTHAGIDNISTYPKLFDFSVSGERAIVICTSGSLSLTQGIITRINRDIQAQAAVNLHNCATLYDVAGYLGGKIREIQEQDRAWLKKDGIDFSCRLLLGGQIHGAEPELFLIYNQGNFIQATSETPFLQIGDTKYGKPILDCTLTYETPLNVAAKCALLSLHSTMRSNLSVGPPIDLIMYAANSFEIKHRLHLCLGDPYLLVMSQLWENALKQASEELSEIDWQQDRYHLPNERYNSRVTPTATSFDPKSLMLQAEDEREF